MTDIDDSWNGIDPYPFHAIKSISCIVTIDDRCSKVFQQAELEYKILEQQFWKLHDMDDEIFNESFDTLESDPKHPYPGHKYSDIINNRLADQELVHKTLKIIDFWYHLKCNMISFCEIYLGFIPEESIIGPHLSMSANDDALWCASHLMTISESVSSLKRQYLIEEQSQRAASYSLLGVYIGIIGLIVGLIGTIIGLYSLLGGLQ